MSSGRVLVVAVVAGALAAGAAACGGEDASDPCETGEAGVLCGVVGNGMRAYNGDGLPAAETALYLVSRARHAPDGRLIVVDFNNHMIRRLEADGTVHTIAGTGVHGFAFDGEPATTSPLENPIDIDFIPGGDLVFASLHDPRVLTLGADGIIHAIAGTGLEGSTGDDGDAGVATFAEINGLVVTPDGGIVIADSKNNRLRVLREGRVRAFAGTDEAGYSGDGGDARDARLSYPTAVAVAPDGAVIVADRDNHAVRRIAPDGTITTVAGTGVRGDSGDGGPAIEAQLDFPDGVAVARDGSILIADRANYRVRRVGTDGVITTIAGSGERGHDGDDGPALAARFQEIARITLEPDGSLLIADQGNSCVRSLVLE